jgi:hypothetical protein
MAGRAGLVLAAALAAPLLTGCQSCSGSSGPAADAGATAAADAAVVNATVLPASSVAAVVNPENLPVYTGPTGSIEGTVTVTGDPPIPTPADFSKCPGAAAIWGTSFREGPGRTLPDAVVGVTGYKGFVPAKSEAQEITIEGCGYSSRTVVMTFGQRLEVKNLSKDFWTPVLQPGPTMVMMMAAPNADPVRLYPKKPGRYLVVDRDRRYVDVDVFVLYQPLATVTDPWGRYRIDGIPVGKVKVSTTHPRFVAEAEAEVEIKAGIIAKHDFVLRHTRPDAGAAPPAADAGYHPVLH